MRFGKLLRIIGKSELVHYKRLWKLFENIKSWSGRLFAWPLIAIFVTIFHYMFSFMHILFEFSLMIFIPGQFDNNMKELELKYKG